ncbi:TetR family transcriptional regulator [Mycolicibacterium sp. (ex Dasyatis americana)]|uniref:TetR family transcriptional regulator n=1 Tax=Mycobacterium syngnathidarum TaxID=1908205 RepID=A0A1Q9W943_9MYCO|nr:MULTISPECIES: TetR/AcrR family transcriptional regulator [Mycobacterium]OFB40310.1 TetR family transcriptional regulator [Mycolicibacterium sp. (ex Dasyatis americana)]MCG7609749.1 TetR/AcrR family transcriptional regulator [Mycobacterium sp. CnD-18-1]OHU01324.1 TetR family transcriptional regulator [Mycobacterium syngnathidarum]OLT95320.1 TetR family transcriptional regulator [Mycobacterium syngnathidarum]TMS48487.1 TetR/AcrR family transcriptional regulator [Mycobacterium sp. DBP42]
MATAARRTSGGPVLLDDVTVAIESAFFEELAAVGYGRLSVDAVARRAGVGKAAIYRRWKSKQDLAVDLVTKVAVAAIDVPDTGTLRGDVRAYLQNGREALTHRLARTIIPDLLAEAARDPDYAAVIAGQIREPRRLKAAQLFERARQRGEITDDADIDVALDMIGGALYWRQSVMQLDADDKYLDRLTDAILTLVAADSRPAQC